MSQAATSAVDSLASVERRFSRRGLLKRYATGRVSYFASRQIMTIAGAAVLFFVNSPASGLAAFGVALLGEAVDCLYLNRVKTKLDQGHDVQPLYIGSTITALVQALTIAVCIALGWFGLNSHGATLFSVAFLAGAAINAGLALPFHKAATIARLCVYGCMLVVIFGSGWLLSGVNEQTMVIDFFGALIMAYLVYVFLDFVQTRFQISTRDTLDLTKMSRDLAEREKETRQLSLVARNAK